MQSPQEGGQGARGFGGKTKEEIKTQISGSSPTNLELPPPGEAGVVVSQVASQGPHRGSQCFRAVLLHAGCNLASAGEL